MLPVLEGIIARRVLLNFRADPTVVARNVPAPLEVLTRHGAAVVGVCLIRLERLRPKGLPEIVGLSSENMAHRVAIRYPTAEGMRDGVFIWRRETDLALVTLLGGRLFPGAHQCAKFAVNEAGERLAIVVRTVKGQADVSFKSHLMTPWRPSPLFASFDEAQTFFQRGDCGFSCSLRRDELEGIQLQTLCWQMESLEVEQVKASFFADTARFPGGSVEFDSALLMRGVPHQWHELNEVPELASRE